MRIGESMFLDPSRNMTRLSQQRRDGWMEIKMGEFFNEDEDDGMLTCRPNDFDSPLQQVLNRCTRN